MNEFGYCYWLMGIFELGQPQTFSEKQVYLIKEHLNLVNQREHTFCNWLDGFLDAHGVGSMDNQKLNKVLEKLRLEFLNVIDKSYPQELWSALQAAHEGKEYVKPSVPLKTESKNSKFQAMC